MKDNMQKEQWKQYANTQYLVSTQGNVWSNKTQKLLSTSDDNRGYLRVSIDGATLKVHRLVALTFIENTDEAAITVNHKDGNKLNNCSENLEWLSHIDNMKHAWLSDLCISGEDTWNAILSEDDVVSIKHLFVKYELNNTELGKLFGVAKGTISKIRSLHTWKIVCPDLVFNKSSPNETNKKKLTGDDIPKIRRLFLEGNSLAEIGRIFKVHSGTVSGIISGKTWKNY